MTQIFEGKVKRTYSSYCTAVRALTSNWLANSVIMIVNKNFFRIKSEFSVQRRTENIFLNGDTLF